MKQRLQQFMMGRYGTDDLSKFNLAVTFVIIIINLFLKTSVLYVLVILLIVLSYFRMFSRNHSKRYAENQVYLKYKNKILRFFNRKKNIMSQRKTHHIYSCPQCHKKVRVPKGKGKICVTCPHCHTEFVKKS